MISFTGRGIWPEWSAESGVDRTVGPSVEDIAVGLGRQSRFAGQTREFYTVLCHSLVAADVARKFWPDDWGLKNVLLLHDAHEAVISDTPTTWKNALTRIDEADIDKRVWAEFDLPELRPTLDLTKRMHRVDAACLAAEAHALGHAEAQVWWPKRSFTELEEYAFDRTVLQLQVGNPIRYTNPDEAIRALKAALR